MLQLNNSSNPFSFKFSVSSQPKQHDYSAFFAGFLGIWGYDHFFMELVLCQSYREVQQGAVLIGNLSSSGETKSDRLVKIPMAISTTFAVAKLQLDICIQVTYDSNSGSVTYLIYFQFGAISEPLSEWYFISEVTLYNIIEVTP